MWEVNPRRRRRCACPYDKDNLHLLVERLDYDLLSQDTVDVYLNPSTQGLGETPCV